MTAADKRGLAGVVAGRTAVSDLDPGVDRLYYRGYDIHDLADHSTFEETAWLLLKGELPDAGALARFRRELSRRRAVPAAVWAGLARLPRGAHPMDFLRTALSFLGAGKKSPDLFDQALTLVAQMPALVAGAGGKKPTAAHPKAGHAENFLRALTGRPPTESEARAFDATLILYAEHGFNASTFAARVTASTLSDLHSAVTSAVGTLKGPLHGGANEKAMEMIEAIGEPARARAWVLKALAEKKKIMGFGHRVYRKKDSRHEVVKRWAGRLSREKCEGRWYDIAQAVEETMMAEKGIFPNLDFYAAVLYRLMGIPIPLYTPIFAASRMAGWCAHVLEQLADNRLIRPDAEYIGLPPRPYPIHPK